MIGRFKLWKADYMRTYCVVYRTGGTDNFKWHRSLAWTNEADARAACYSTVKAGFKAHVEHYERSIAIGLPDTYAYRIDRPIVY